MCQNKHRECIIRTISYYYTQPVAVTDSTVYIYISSGKLSSHSLDYREAVLRYRMLANTAENLQCFPTLGNKGKSTIETHTHSFRRHYLLPRQG